MAQGDPGVGASARQTRVVTARVLAAWILLPAFFLVTGGTLLWWEAWAYCAILLVPMTLFVAFMARYDPEFIARRLKLQEKERTQRRVLAWGLPAYLGMILIPGLDRRFGWSGPSLAVVVVALAISLVGYLTILRCFVENRWAGRTVEVYPGQEVVSTGPYAIVRHPMYAGSTALYLATPVALGSWWAVLLALAFLPVFVFRILNEEQVLIRELPGYDAYRRRVRYRLIPFVW